MCDHSNSFRSSRDQLYVRYVDADNFFCNLSCSSTSTNHHLKHLFMSNSTAGRVGYTVVPLLPTNTGAKMYQFKLGHHNGYIRHLAARRNHEQLEVTQLNVALHHFPEEVLILNAKHTHGRYFIKSVTGEVGRRVLMTMIDMIPGALPNQSLFMANAFVRSKEVVRFENGLDMFTPARISQSSRKAVRDAQTSVAAELLSSRKAERKTDDDNKIRSSLSEVQEKYFKRLLREHKTIVENLSAEVTLVKQRINESEVKLALELEENDINEKIYKTNDTQRLSTPVSSQGQIEKNRLLPI